MPVTFAVWVVGGAALVGIPPLAGFFSKDAVLDAVWLGNPAAAVALFIAALLTGYYTVRATKLALFGEWRGQGHSHESPASMLVPLVILAIPAATLGFAASWIARTLGEHPEPLSLPLSAVAVTLGVVGGAVAWKTVRSETEEPRLGGTAGSVWSLLGRGFGYDAAVMRFVVQPTVAACRGLWAIVDRFVIDGIVEGSAVATRALSNVISRAQTGDGQRYATFMAIAVVVLLSALILVGR
jgi:NADH-quinone oxidoreductase subunit L